MAMKPCMGGLPPPRGRHRRRPGAPPYNFARRVLAPGGAFAARFLQGGTEAEMLAVPKRDFAVVRHMKPPASRKDSAEMYVVATGFRGP